VPIIEALPIINYRVVKEQLISSKMKSGPRAHRVVMIAIRHYLCTMMTRKKKTKLRQLDLLCDKMKKKNNLVQVSHFVVNIFFNKAVSFISSFRF